MVEMTEKEVIKIELSDEKQQEFDDLYDQITQTKLAYANHLLQADGIKMQLNQLGQQVTAMIKGYAQQKCIDLSSYTLNLDTQELVPLSEEELAFRKKQLEQMQSEFSGQSRPRRAAYSQEQIQQMKEQRELMNKTSE